MTTMVPAGTLLTFAVGGGWGDEEASAETTPCLVVRGTDLTSVRVGSLDGVPLRYETPKKLASRALQDGDIILEISGGSKGQPTGRTALVTQQLLDRSRHPVIPASFCRLLRPDRSQVRPRYLYYWLQEMYSSGRVWAYQNQSTGIANFQMKVFTQVEMVRLPPLEEQERIAGVLGAFDDLIETNRRLIESLDQTATHRANQLAKVASGDWLKFADVADIGGGGTPSTKSEEYWGGVHPWATPKDITALPSRYIFDTPRKLTDAGLAKCSSPLRPVGSILMTSRATVGEFALAKVPLAVNQGFIVVNGESPADTTWLYFEMRRRTPEFKTIAAKGSTFPEISRREFRSLDVHWPEPRLRQQLHREVAPLLQAAAELECEVGSLTAHRDELLPLLMSGKVRVRDVEASVS